MAGLRRPLGHGPVRRRPGHLDRRLCRSGVCGGLRVGKGVPGAPRPRVVRLRSARLPGAEGAPRPTRGGPANQAGAAVRRAAHRPSRAGPTGHLSSATHHAPRGSCSWAWASSDTTTRPESTRFLRATRRGRPREACPGVGCRRGGGGDWTPVVRTEQNYSLHLAPEAANTPVGADRHRTGDVIAGMRSDDGFGSPG